MRLIKNKISELLSSIKQVFMRSDEISNDGLMAKNVTIFDDIILAISKVKNEDIKGLSEHIQKACSHVETCRDRLGEAQIVRREFVRDRELNHQLLQEELEEKKVSCLLLDWYSMI